MSSSRPRSRPATVAVFIGVGALAACVAAKPGPTLEATGVPVGAGINIPPGSNEDFIVNVGRRLYFDENSAQLSDTAKVTLDKQAEWLQRYAGYKIKIEGFADDPGTADFNKALGLKRAEAARAYFASIGLPATRMRVKSFGNERPVNKCADISCWSQNRRVVTVLDTEVGS